MAFDDYVKTPIPVRQEDNEDCSMPLPHAPQQCHPIAVVVGDDGLARSILGLCVGHQPERVSYVDRGLRAGDASLFELALGFAEIGLADVR